MRGRGPGDTALGRLCPFGGHHRAGACSEPGGGPALEWALSTRSASWPLLALPWPLGPPPRPAVSPQPSTFFRSRQESHVYSPPHSRGAGPRRGLCWVGVPLPGLHPLLGPEHPEGPRVTGPSFLGWVQPVPRRSCHLGEQPPSRVPGLCPQSGACRHSRDACRDGGRGPRSRALGTQLRPGGAGRAGALKNASAQPPGPPRAPQSWRVDAPAPHRTFLGP